MRAHMHALPLVWSVPTAHGVMMDEPRALETRHPRAVQSFIQLSTKDPGQRLERS
jgi:hypothetical protein